MESGLCGDWRVESGLWRVESELWTVERGEWNVWREESDQLTGEQKANERWL